MSDVTALTVAYVACTVGVLVYAGWVVRRARTLGRRLGIAPPDPSSRPDADAASAAEAHESGSRV